MKIVSLFVDIFEGDNEYPAVTHVFNGKTREEAQHYFDSHMETDRFLKAMVSHGRWHGGTGRVKKRWVEN